MAGRVRIGPVGRFEDEDERGEWCVAGSRAGWW